MLFLQTHFPFKQMRHCSSSSSSSSSRETFMRDFSCSETVLLCEELLHREEELKKCTDLEKKKNLGCLSFLFSP
jgi:hypothetical protein